MKTIVITFLLAAFAMTDAFSQTVNNVPIKDINVEYIQIVGTSKLMSNKVTIEIDFGQENNYWTNKDVQVKDENGKNVTFNSMIDALNFMSKQGYGFVQAYAITVNNQNVYHFLMKKEKIQHP